MRPNSWHFSCNTIVSVWIEVFCQNKWRVLSLKDERFVIADFEQSSDEKSSRFTIDKLENEIKFPLCYAVAFNGGIRDVTARYAANWLTDTKKLRIKYVEKNNDNWWKATCEKFPSRTKHLEQEEDRVLSKAIIGKDIPKTLSKVKGHPLYVAARHVLKYEIIWPVDTVCKTFFLLRL